MKPFKIKITRSLAEEFDRYISFLINTECTTNEERLLIATVAQVGAKISGLLGEYRQIKKSYTLTLKPAQAIAIALLSEQYVTDKTSYLGNKLHMLSNQINQQYN